MKSKIIYSFLGLFLLLALTTMAQQPSLPQPPEAGKLPLPKNPRILGPADLRIEEFSLVSIQRDGANKKMNIQVRVRVKNHGETRCGASSLVAGMTMPAVTGPTRTLTTTFPIPSINAGAEAIKVFTFREPESLFRTGNFEFWVKADGRGVVPESDETNNQSPKLTITIPAR